jgi:hypothetical protein
MSTIRRLAGRFGHRPLILAAIGVSMLAFAGGALAYFLVNADSGGAQSVGYVTAANPQDQPGTLAVASDYVYGGGALLPGGPAATVHFTVTNNGAYDLSSLTTVPAIRTATGATPLTPVVFDAVQGAPAPGCLASWFTLGNEQLPTGTLAKGAQAKGSVDVSMVNASTNQNACRGVSPEITVSATGTANIGS